MASRRQFLPRSVLPPKGSCPPTPDLPQRAKVTERCAGAIASLRAPLSPAPVTTPYLTMEAWKRPARMTGSRVKFQHELSPSGHVGN